MARTDQAGTRIAELERELKLLRKREEELTDFIENGSIGLHWVAADGTILWANQAELDMLGYSKSEYLGHHISDFHADQAVIQDILQRLQANETLRNYEARLRCKDGSVRCVVISSNVLWDRDRFVHTRCFTRDITDRKKVEEELINAYRMLEQVVTELRAREELFRVALGKSPVVIFQQNTDLRYKWVYNAFPEHQNISIKDKTDTELFPPEEAEQLTRLKQNVLKTGKGFRQEVTLTSGGKPRIMDVMVEPFRNSLGEMLGILGTAVDVTDRKLTEERFRISRQQLRSLAARIQSMREEERAFTSREVHDLAQALTGLELRLAVVADSLTDQGDPGALAERLRGISELLASTIESSAKISTELRPSLLDSFGLAVAIDWHLREFSSRTGIRAATDLPDKDLSLNPKVATSVFRIFQDILSNVERHAHACEVIVSLEILDEGLLLQVNDNGRGITEQEISDPKSIGLLEMRELALVFGGSLDIRRNRDKGTKVSLSIPKGATMPEAACGIDPKRDSAGR